jgi:hypothetical protein
VSLLLKRIHPAANCNRKIRRLVGQRRKNNTARPSTPNSRMLTSTLLRSVTKIFWNPNAEPISTFTGYSMQKVDRLIQTGPNCSKRELFRFSRRCSAEPTYVSLQSEVEVMDAIVRYTKGERKFVRTMGVLRNKVFKDNGAERPAKRGLRKASNIIVAMKF